jgi:hypothetical protein
MRRLGVIAALSTGVWSRSCDCHRITRLFPAIFASREKWFRPVGLLFRRRRRDEANSRDCDYKPRLEHKLTVAPPLLTLGIIGILSRNPAAIPSGGEVQGRATP